MGGSLLWGDDLALIQGGETFKGFSEEGGGEGRPLGTSHGPLKSDRGLGTPGT